MSLAAAALSGCGQKGPETAEVSGRVTYRGNAVAEADVTFVPDDGQPSASGRTDQDGRYRLGTFELDDGAIVGKHRVMIMALGPPKPLPPGAVGSGLPGDMQPGDPRIPQKYFSPDSSGLAREVLAGESNVFDFELTD
jgi:hypothetical protein